MTRARIGLLSVLLFVPGLASAQTTVAGNWDVTINSPQGANTSLVVFKQDGDKVSGVLKGRGGRVAIRGRHPHRQRSEVLLHDQHAGHGASDHADRQGRRRHDERQGRLRRLRRRRLDREARVGDRGAPPRRRPTTTATTTTAPAAASSTTGANGKWDVLLVTPGGEFPATATLTDTAGKISGTFASQMGEVAVTGTLEGKALKMTMVAQTPQGDMTVVLTGDVDGDAIVNGQAEVPGVGAMPWSAKRTKQ